MKIVEIIDILRQEPFYNCGEAIEIAKGGNELSDSFLDLFKKVVRKVKYKK